MHPLVMEELAAERSRVLRQQAHQARLGAAVGGSRRRPLARRLGLWFLSAGTRMMGRAGDRVDVELACGGTDGRRAVKLGGRLRG